MEPKHTQLEIKCLVKNILIIIFAMMPILSLGQCNNDIGQIIEGKVIKGDGRYQMFSVLLQDTCSPFNKFLNSSFNYSDKNNNELTSYIIDSTLFFKVDSFLDNYDKFKQLTEYVRIYAGCLDLVGDTCIVVQFVNVVDFLRNRRFLSEMNLIMGGNVKFIVAYLKIINSDVVVLRHTPLIVLSKDYKMKYPY